ncbi:MAG: hypothetical protein WA579_15260, partial [Rhodomicrobium sp.]
QCPSGIADASSRSLLAGVEGDSVVIAKPLFIRVLFVLSTRSSGSPPLTQRPQVGAATGMP